MVYRNVIAICSLLLLFGHAVADDAQRHQKVGGMDVYLGVIPAQLTQGHPKMHSGASLEEHRYHILVALFDNKTGKRITDAEIKTTVSPLGQIGKTMVLEPMHEEVRSFGNYFTLLKPEHYRIKLEIQRGNEAPVVTASFVYQRPRD